MAGRPESFASVERPFGAGDKVKLKRTVVDQLLRVVTWCCVLGLAVLSLLPAQDMVRAELNISSPMRDRRRSRWRVTAQPEVPRKSSAPFGCTPAFLSISSTSLRGGIQRWGISRRRRSGRSAVGSLSRCSCGGWQSGCGRGFAARRTAPASFGIKTSDNSHPLAALAFSLPAQRISTNSCKLRLKGLRLP